MEDGSDGVVTGGGISTAGGFGSTGGLESVEDPELLDVGAVALLVVAVEVAAVEALPLPPPPPPPQAASNVTIARPMSVCLFTFFIPFETCHERPAAIVGMDAESRGVAA